jgi:hypothetical protein
LDFDKNAAPHFPDETGGPRFKGCLRNVAVNSIDLNPDEIQETSDFAVNACPKF